MNEYVNALLAILSRFASWVREHAPEWKARLPELLLELLRRAAIAWLSGSMEQFFA